jgi:hypothetical protein
MNRVPAPSSGPEPRLPRIHQRHSSLVFGTSHLYNVGSMKQRSPHHPVRDVLQRLKRFFKREPESPDDPYALVGAPKKPRPPHRSAAAAVELE